MVLILLIYWEGKIRWMSPRRLEDWMYTIDAQYIINIGCFWWSFISSKGPQSCPGFLSHRPTCWRVPASSETRNHSPHWPMLCVLTTCGVRGCVTLHNCSSEFSGRLCSTIESCNQPITSCNENASGSLVSFKFMGLIYIWNEECFISDSFYLKAKIKHNVILQQILLQWLFIRPPGHL